MISFSRSTTYYTLVGSLPALPGHFEQAERMPISALRLRSRLKMLEPDDATVVEEITEFLAWERQPLELTDKDVGERYDRFMRTIPDPFALSLIEQVMTIRTIIAGLRCRRLEQEFSLSSPPVAGQIARNWSHPDFRLGGRFPWILEVDALLTSDAPFELERKILDIAWTYVSRLAERFHFTFEAVVLYLMRWEILYRWIQRDAAAGQAKFDRLVAEAMGEYAELFD
ncbi:MAG: DUF2764 family protein [Planctomycetota bacterium]